MINLALVTKSSANSDLWYHPFKDGKIAAEIQLMTKRTNTAHTECTQLYDSANLLQIKVQANIKVRQKMFTQKQK